MREGVWVMQGVWVKEGVWVMEGDVFVLFW